MIGHVRAHDCADDVGDLYTNGRAGGRYEDVQDVLLNGHLVSFRDDALIWTRTGSVHVPASGDTVFKVNGASLLCSAVLGVKRANKRSSSHPQILSFRDNLKSCSRETFLRLQATELELRAFAHVDVWRVRRLEELLELCGVHGVVKKRKQEDTLRFLGQKM